MASKKREKEESLAEAFGVTVRSCREKAGLTQDKLAFHAGITPGYLSQIERGITNVTLPILWNLARAMEVRPIYLVRDTEKRFPMKAKE